MSACKAVTSSAKLRPAFVERMSGCPSSGRATTSLGSARVGRCVTSNAPGRLRRQKPRVGTDLTTTITGEGQVAVFVAFDHYSAECVGIHAARRATRFEALEPIRQGVRRCFGAFAKEIARGLAVRHDHGSQYMSDAFQKELAFLGIESSPAFVRAPEGNGCAERFIRTLKENLLWVRTFDTVEQLRHALIAFREVYNTTWLIERHGFRPPAAFRAEQLPPAAKAG